MSVTINQGFRCDENAEWHLLEGCQDPLNKKLVICMVCGEGIPADQFFVGVKKTCPDCGIYLEMVKAERPNGDYDRFLVHYTDEKNASCADDFYKRLAS